MKKILFLLALLILSFISLNLKAQIRSAVYWTAPKMNLNQIESLSKFDLVIIDLENMINNHNILDSLKKRNPKILLIAYSNPQEIFNSQIGSRPLQKAWTETIKNNYPQWFLKTNLGNKVIFYPGMCLLNLSSECPKINGQDYGQFMDSLLLEKVLIDPIWDGYFMDNGTPNIAWVCSGSEKIDANNDHLADNPIFLDQSWSQGVHLFLKRIREAKGKKFIILANKGVPAFMDILNGRMFENFPNNYLGDKIDEGWWQNIANAHQTGNYTIFQVETNNLKLAITSALLLDHSVYIAVGQNNTEWYPEFETELKKGKNIIIKRQFKNGFIQIFPASKTGKIFLKK